MSATEGMSHFAQTILNQKYAHTKSNGNKETWPEICERVVKSVMGSYLPDQIGKVQGYMEARKFLPGGRYLYAAGKRFPQCQNCALFSVEDSREGWADLMHKVTTTLMTGAGIGVVYSKLRHEGAAVGGMGGLSTGPLALMQMVNEAGRHIMQGGARRSAIWGGLHWNHPDIKRFVKIKNWIPEVRELKQKDFNFPATLDMTNVSVILDDEFFKAYPDTQHPDHALANEVYNAVIKQMCKTGEPGFGIDIGEHAGEHLKNACVPAGTRILTKSGYVRIDKVLNQDVEVWNGEQWSTVTPKITGYNQPILKVSLSDGTSLRCTPDHKWLVARAKQGRTYDVQEVETYAKDLQVGDRLTKYGFPVVEYGSELKDAYTHGFYCGDGFDSQGRPQAWLYGKKKALLPELSGACSSTGDSTATKVRISFPKSMPAKFVVPMKHNVTSRLEWLAGVLDSDGTVVRNKNSVALQVASVNLKFLKEIRLLLTTLGVSAKVTKAQDERETLLPDGKGGKKLYQCQKLYRLLLNASDTAHLVKLGLRTRRLDLSKLKPNREARRYVTVVSVEPDGVADTVYCFNEPLAHRGVFEGIVTAQCTEVCSSDDSDVCNLSSINLSKLHDINDLAEVTWNAIGFMLCGTLYSTVPFSKMGQVRDKNRRLGLGLMGISEWLLVRGKQYGPDEELGQWLDVYRKVSDEAAEYWAAKLGTAVPVARRAIAPTGTIAIVAETTSGIEPIFATAIKRRYLKGKNWKAQYVIDAGAQRIIDNGVDPSLIEDAYDLAENVERRISFQAWVQSYVDMAISSTINMPAWGSSLNNEATVKHFGSTLFRYLPNLRGITVYPDGARGGQPLTKVPYEVAKMYQGHEFDENGDDVSVDVQEFGNERACVNGVCGV